MSCKDLTKTEAAPTHFTVLMQNGDHRKPKVFHKSTGLRFHAEQFMEAFSSLQALISKKIHALYVKLFQKTVVTPAANPSITLTPKGDITPKNAFTITLGEHQEKFGKMREISRLVLNNPSSEMRELVKTMFIKLGDIITKYNLTAADLDFLVESVPESRSAFSWIHTPNPEQRREKLETLIHKLYHLNDVADYATEFDEHFAQYAADLETIGSALGYRAIGSSVKDNPKSQPSDNMKALLKDMQPYMISHIGQTEFPHRRTDDASRYVFQYPSIEIPQGRQDKVDGGLPEEQLGPSSRQFTLNSYVAKALSHGIEMRGHVSGTAPLTLAGFQFILNEGIPRAREDASLIPLNESSLMKLGGLLCATYVLGDFHTIMETAAGVAHFYQSYLNPKLPKLFSNVTTQRLEDLPAKTFYALSFGMLNAIVSDRAMDEFNAKTQDLLDLYVD